MSTKRIRSAVPQHQTRREAEQSASRLCPYAKSFLQWTQVELSPLIDATPDIVTVNLCYLKLLHNYFARRSAIPKDHRYLCGPRSHRCIFHVFETVYRQLRNVELNLPASRASIPDPTYKPRVDERPPQFDMGEFLADEESNE